MQDIDLNPIVKKIAVELTIITGELWTARADNSNYNQRPHADSPTATLYFSQDWRTKSRLTIRADAPAEIQEPRTGESITCDLTRTPQAIAQDINRRLLPHARAHLAVDCALCHCSTVVLSDGIHCIECGRVYKSHSH